MAKPSAFDRLARVNVSMPQGARRRRNRRRQARRGGIEALLLGSTAQKLVNLANCAVIVVPGAAAPTSLI
jgi:hypothetical protein